MRTTHPPRRGILLVGGAAALLFGNAGVALAMSTADDPTSFSVARDTVTICHANDAESNPYIVEHPAKDGDLGGHGDHTGPLWAPGSKAAGIVWGDIIPPFDYTDSSGATLHYPGLNWPAGQPIYDNGCAIPDVQPSQSPTPVVTVSPTPEVTVTPVETVSPTPEGTVEPTSATSPTATVEPTTGGGGTIVVPTESTSPSAAPFTGGGGTIVTLPHTGVPTQLLASVSAGLLALGSWLSFAGRRRKA